MMKRACGALLRAMRSRQAWLAAGILVLALGAESALAAALVRGPYLQRASSSGIVLRWRTDLPTDSVVQLGSAPGALAPAAQEATPRTDHELALGGLVPDTTYFYAVGDSTGILAGADAAHFFRTAPVPGTPAPTRIWAIGDSGTRNDAARAVRDAYLFYAGGVSPDVWLLLGDNAYDTGTDLEYQDGLYNMFPSVLATTAAWSTFGNHDAISSDSNDHNGPYYDMFTFPEAGEAGGVPSGSEAFYSFEHGNIHFVCLDSSNSSMLPGSPMLTWLDADLSANTRTWTIVMFHHPPYTRGAHDSDTDDELTAVRQSFLPILEAHGVDLVLSGHDHNYERSYLLDGHYGTASTLSPAMILAGGSGNPSTGGYHKPALANTPHAGTVYVVAGSSGSAHGGPLDHPAMYYSTATLGSLVIDVNGTRLDAKFLTSDGNVADSFAITKGTDTAPPHLLSAASVSPTSVRAFFSEPLDPTSAENPAAYATLPSSQVTAASLDEDGRSVLLSISGLAVSTDYELSAPGVYDIAGNPTAPGSHAVFRLDGAPPSVPTGLTASSVTAFAVSLVWDASSDDVGVTGYRVWRDGIPILTVPATAAIDGNVALATTYHYQVTALDAAGHESAPSAVLSATTPVLSPVTVVFRDGDFPSADYAGTRDTTLVQATPDVALGAATSVRVDGDDPSGTGQDVTALIAFELSSIPQRAQILSASLRLDVTNPTVDSYALYEMGRPWDEATATWNLAATGSAWGLAGAAAASDRGTTPLGFLDATSSHQRDIAFNADGIATLQRWVTGTAPNYGMALAGPSFGDGVSFTSREGLTALRPELTITYVVPLNQPPVIVSTPPTQGRLGFPYAYVPSASDPNLGEVLDFSLDQAPHGMSIGGVNGRIDWTPQTGQEGFNPVALRVTDRGTPVLSDLQKFSIQVAPPISAIYFSTRGDTPVPGVEAPYDDADVYRYDGSSFTRVFDASAAGLPADADVDALAIGPDGELYLSFERTLTAVPGVGKVEDEDVVLYRATSLPPFSMYFDGTSAGLGNSDSEDVDALDLLPDGSLLISTEGRARVPGLGGTWDDEDVLRCVPASLGQATTWCQWQLWLDGSDLALTQPGEDVSGVALDASGNLYLTVLKHFSSGGLEGTSSDILGCMGPVIGAQASCSRGEMLIFKGSDEGISDAIDAIEIR